MISKTEEDLHREQHSYLDTYHTGVEKAFNTFKKRINFYKKYKDNPEKYIKDKQPNYKEIQKFFVGGTYDKMKAIVCSFDFNDYLFSYCFGGI